MNIRILTPLFCLIVVLAGCSDNKSVTEESSTASAMPTGSTEVAGSTTNSVVADEWNAYIDALRPIAPRLAEQLPDMDDEQQRYELYEYIFSQMSAAYIGLFHSHPEHPNFWPSHNNAFTQGWPGPDNSYYTAPVDDDGIYKLSGYRGSTHYVGIQVNSGLLAPYGAGDYGDVLAKYELDELTLAEDGAFEVILSATRPEGYDGDWWELKPGTTFLFLRQVSHDWLNEVDARIAIDRLDTPAARPRADAEEIKADIEALVSWAGHKVAKQIQYANARGTNHPEPNSFVLFDLANFGGVPTQYYIESFFELGPDEALVVETEIPENCRYWNFQMADRLWRTIDEFSQTNFNGHSAKLNDDGVLRFVVSDQDPGVPNWLDTVGRERGIVYGRWNDCEGEPFTPRAKKVQFSEVRQHMPADTPVITAEQRELLLRDRRKGLQLRRRW